MNKRSVGGGFEKDAAAFLQEMGYEILEMNYRCRQGEIDIVAREGRYLVFAEVKYRSGLREGSPFEAVGPAKQKKISRTALYYLTHNRLSEGTPVRFDVIGITPEKTELIRNAFDYTA